MKSKFYLTIILMFGLLILPFSRAFACGDFLISGPNNTWINGRSMEFAVDMQSQIVLHPRGEKYSSASPQGTGVQWVSKYGFVGLNSFGLDVTADGLNEKGLSMGALWLPGTQYPEPKASEQAQALLLNDFPNWILGNFENIDQVKHALSHIIVWAKLVPEMGMIPPLHFSIHDANGKSLVIEFVRGKMVVSDNPLGILTNAPTLDKQLKNLEKYKDLSNVNQPKIVDGQTINGSGMLGLPGDWTPPSRFVRLAMLVKYVLMPQDSAQAANLAFHILDTVDIPRGIIKAVESGKTIYEYTQWSVVKDLSKQRFYIRPYENLKISFIDLKQIPWDKIKKQKSMGLNSQSLIPNLTAEMLK